MQGTILFDGSLKLSGSASYVGRGTIYSTGQITSSNNTHLFDALKSLTA